jgi:hypothetical protein
MLKTLTLSLSLAVALGFCSVSRAGGLFHSEGCSTCGIASPQGPMPTAQCAPSPQGECFAPVACEKKKCHLFEGLSGMGNKMSCGFNDLCKKMKPKPKMYTYEWVLKKKRVWCHKGNPCGAPACESCSGVTPSAQGYASPQGEYGTPQAYGAVPAYGTGQAYGTGYSAPAYTGGPSSATPNLTPAPPERGDEAPPAPEVAPSTTPAPAAPLAPPAPPAPSTPPTTSGLLFSTPSGN